jgi:hypothetical protein
MRARLAPSLLLCAVSGCVEDVPVAAECPPDRSGPCLVEVDGQAGFDSGVPERDGSSVPLDGRVSPPPDVDAALRDAAGDAEPPDAAELAPDAGPDPVPDAGTPWPYVTPPIDNASFEFANSFSVTGDVTTVTSLTTSISPWYTCQTVGGLLDSSTGVRAETKLNAGTSVGAPKVNVDPTQGRTFITMGYWANLVPVPLIQPLETPLQPGQRYAFAVDALATSQTGQLSLQVRANQTSCIGAQTTLYTSAPITSLSWTTLCVSFSAPTQLPYLMLTVDRTSASVIPTASDLLSGPRLLLDNIRPATPEECPEL